MAPVSYNGPHADELAQLFVTFCSFGSSKRVEEMDGAKFAKFCRDTKIVDKKFTTTDVDLTYAKAKAKGARKIDYVQFVKALELVAEKKAASLDDIVAKAVAAGGPSSSGTQAEPNKFHDDKSLYTGTHVQGGPTNVDNVITLSNLADRSSADVRGLPKRLSDEGKPKFDRAEKGGYAAVEPAGGSPKKAALSSQSSFKAEKRISGSYTGGSLQDVFDDFCSFGAGSSGKPVNQMDGAKFVKLCKDCGLVDKKFTTTSVDLVFSKVKPKGERKITFSQFQAALAAIAESKGCSAADVEAKVVAAKGPSSSGTVAEAVKFHDDKALYTGVHAKGGPTTVDNKITLSSLADRTASDIRGIKINDKY